MSITRERTDHRPALEIHEEPRPEVREEPVCDCVHERMSDGIHHYLHLPSVEESRGEPMVINERVTQEPGSYVAIAVQSDGRLCFMRPAWRGHFRGDSEAGEIAPTTRSLCDWCKKHWSAVKSVRFETLH